MENFSKRTSRFNRLSVITVGTGSSTLRLDRRGPCTLLALGESLVAVDLGSGALRGLLRQGVHPEALDALFLTHLHPDHVADLVALLFAANYGEPPRRRPLTVVGGEGVSAYLDALRGAHGRWLAPKGCALTVQELSPGQEVVAGAFSAQVGTVSHIPSSLSYRFANAGRTLVLSGDTGPSAELEAFAHGADVLFLEASLPEGEAAAGHLTAGQAGSLARRAAARRLVLHHLTAASEACSPAEAAAEAFGGPVTVARDGGRIRL